LKLLESNVCFQEANRDGKYDKIIQNAEKFVRGVQIDEGDGKDVADFSYGGATYGGQGRPDLSNTTFLIEALRAAGAGKDDEAIKKALVFVSRCQNLETEHNTTPFAAKNPDGGFYYTCAADGASAADKLPNGRTAQLCLHDLRRTQEHDLRGPGAGRSTRQGGHHMDQEELRSEKQPRPRLGRPVLLLSPVRQGAACLGVDSVTDADGVRHDWRQELIAELAARQREDGSWINDNERWLEKDPNLVTGYVLLALSYCKKDGAKYRA
jgi:squalene-hopene/tetraprenyl-beta-curcumene cyclase